MNNAKVSISIYVFMMGFLTMLILSGSAKGESQWYSGSNNNGVLERGQSVEINFDTPKNASKVYIETGCESGLAIYGSIHFYDGFGDNQIIVLSIPFSKVMCGTTINVEKVVKTTKVRLLMSQALNSPYNGMAMPSQTVSLTTWKVYAEDISFTKPNPTSTPSQKALTGIVSLHGEKTDVLVGEDVIFKLSAVNKITKPVMTVQVILIPPSGMSVTSSEFVTSGAGQYTSTYKLEPGAGKDIEIRVKTNQQGDFNVRGEIILYYGDDKTTAEEQTQFLPIIVREISKTPTPTSQIPIPSTPTLSFWVSLLIFGFSFRLTKRKLNL